jgi:type VI secretion system protein VasD
MDIRWFLYSATRILGILFFIVLMAACASQPKKRTQPVSVIVSFSAARNLNPDMNGRPSPAVITVLKLKSSTTFMATDYFTLTEGDKGSLGGDILFKESFSMQPGESMNKTYTFDPADVALGIMVGYRQMDNHVWRAATDLPEEKRSRIGEATQSLLPDFMKSGPPVFKYTVTIGEKALKLAPSANK